MKGIKSKSSLLKRKRVCWFAASQKPAADTPLSGHNLTLLESLQKEREWLFPLRDIAYCIDTSKMNAQQLRYAVQQWLNIERCRFAGHS